jgi:hypothetical protein
LHSLPGQEGTAIVALGHLSQVKIGYLPLVPAAKNRYHHHNIKNPGKNTSSQAYSPRA